MARKPSFLELLIWTFSIPIASCYSIGLGNDIASLVPTCAQPCLVSFIRSNYPTVDCGANFTLPCLCPAQSLSGFTIGEAALQCLLGYVQLGLCDEQDASGSIPAGDLNMCKGQKSALPNTHPTLTATLVIPPSGVPILLPPTSSHTTPSTSSTVRTTLTTSRTTTHTLSLPTSSPTSAPASSQGSVLGPVSSTTVSPTSSPTSEPPSTVGLAPAQIAGISVGVAGAIAIAGGAIFLARCMRRRRFPDSESQQAFFEKDNNSTGGLDPLGSRGSRIFHISPPVLRTSRYRPDFIPRAAPAPANIDRNTIGLAISRPRSLVPPRPSPKIPGSIISSPPPVEVPLERKPSRLLPPRPALTLNIPSKAVPPSAPSSQAPPTTDRASTFTNLTGFADLDSEAAEDPQSATTLYIADKYGNWIAQITESPIEKQEEANKMAAAISAAAAIPVAPKPAFLFKNPTNRTYSQSSSSYSQVSAARQAGRRYSFNRNSASRSRKNSGGPVINRSDSKASVTTIQTSSTGGNEDGLTYENDIARLSQLSPVKESPDPASKQPRVPYPISYPKIPGRLDGATIRYVPPPKRPNFTGSPSGQPSPTLGVVYPVQDSPSAYPLPLNTRRKENRFAPIQRSGSGFTPEPPNVEVFPLPNFARPNEMSNSGPYLRSDVAPIQQEGPYRYAVESQERDPFRTPPQRSIATFTPSPPSTRSAEKRPSTPPEPIMDRGRPRGASGTSFGTVSSTASSLLAKRLGSDRAAALVLDPNGKKAQQWTRQGGGNNGDFLSPDVFSVSSPQGTLPQTPIWQPKLTPTRRGDDLFLNVQ
ncbi:hypothetical protein F5Y12DRAFT_784509 [Xylaria sp. FL1777]|nr:hypothetical protein F5Y12DRAFT_784509 [Xylaria sp. FL1777]